MEAGTAPQGEANQGSEEGLWAERCGAGSGGDVARELRSCQHKQALASHVTEFAFYLKSFRKTLKVLSGGK